MARKKRERKKKEPKIFEENGNSLLGHWDARPSAPPALKDTVAPYDPLNAFLREIQQYPLLSPDEEKHLADNYVKTHDAQLAAKLVTSNLRLVVKIAFEYRRAYRNIMDLIQEGNIGLMQAVKKFDPDRGVKLVVLCQP